MKGHKKAQMSTWLLFTCACIIIFASPVQAAGRNKAASATLLPKELKQTEILDNYREMGTKQAGRLQTVIGHVVVANEDLTRGYYAAPGDKIFEKDAIFTLGGSRCRIALNGEDIITMGENTHIGVKSFSADSRSKKSILNMAKGKAMFYALRLLRYHRAIVEVETPTTAVGVRGTKWGTEVIELDNKTTSSLPIQVADLSDTGFRQLAANQGQPSSQTNVFSYEGTVTVTSVQTGQTTKISGGQGINTSFAGLGKSYPVPAVTLRKFSMDTYAPPPASPATTSTGSNAIVTTGGTATAKGGFTELTSTVATAEPPLTTSTSGAVETTTIGNVTLVDTSMVTQQQQNLTTVPETLHTVYEMTTVFENGTVNGHTVDNGVVYGPDGFESTRPIPAIPPSGRTIVGSNAYLEWGYWSSYAYFDPNPSSIGITYYVGGIQTSDSQIAALKTSGLVGNYTGTAIGAHYEGGFVTQMAGTFGANINFATSAVTNFNISASGGGKSASISGASGTLGNIGYGANTFKVSGGTVAVSGSPAVTAAGVYGRLYGTNGQAVGGNWWIHGSNNTRAGGVFQGVR